MIEPIHMDETNNWYAGISFVLLWCFCLPSHVRQCLLLRTIGGFVAPSGTCQSRV